MMWNQLRSVCINSTCYDNAVSATIEFIRLVKHNIDLSDSSCASLMSEKSAMWYAQMSLQKNAVWNMC